MSRGKGLSIIEANLLSRGIRPLPGTDNMRNIDINSALGNIPREDNSFSSLIIEKISRHMAISPDSVELLLIAAFKTNAEISEDDMSKKCYLAYRNTGTDYLIKAHYLEKDVTSVGPDYYIVTTAGLMAAYQCTNIDSICFEGFERLDGGKVSREYVGLEPGLPWTPIRVKKECLNKQDLSDFITDIQEAIKGFYCGGKYVRCR